HFLLGIRALIIYNESERWMINLFKTVFGGISMDVFVESKSGPEVESDFFVVGFFEDDDAPQGCFADIDRHLDGALSLLIKEGEIKPEKEHVQIVHTLGKLPSKKILCVGLGKKEAFDVEQAKKTFALTTK